MIDVGDCPIAAHERRGDEHCRGDRIADDDRGDRFGQQTKPILTIGCTTPRIAAEATGSAISHSDRPDKFTWTRYINRMPTTIAAKPRS